MEKLYTANYGDYFASLTGACIVAFGLGVVLADYIGGIIWFVIILGVLLHAWGMYRTHIAHRTS